MEKYDSMPLYYGLYGMLKIGLILNLSYASITFDVLCTDRLSRNKLNGCSFMWKERSSKNSMNDSVVILFGTIWEVTKPFVALIAATNAYVATLTLDSSISMLLCFALHAFL